MKVSPASRSRSVAWKVPPGPPPLHRPARVLAASSASPHFDGPRPSFESSMNRHMPAPTIPFIDVVAQRRRLGAAVDEAVARVLAHCQFINGPEVGRLEADLAAFCGASHVVTCASGTDALVMVLMGKGVGSGDAILCPSFTFCATGEAVALSGATPVFVDVDEATFNI